MKLAALPNWAIALETSNWFLTITAIGLQRLVTKAIMKNSRYIIAMGSA